MGRVHLQVHSHLNEFTMYQLNVEQARFNMIEQQIRPWEVLDQRVLDLMYEVPRENFVPMAYRNLAFADINIPLAHDQVMMFPNVEGRLLQALMVWIFLTRLHLRPKKSW